MVAISDFAQGLFDYDADRDIALYGGLQGIVLADFLLGLEKNKSPNWEIGSINGRARRIRY